MCLNIVYVNILLFSRFIGKIAGMAVYHGKLLDGIKETFVHFTDRG